MSSSSTRATEVNASAAGTFVLGGDLKVNRMGYGAMRLTGEGIWGEPKDADAARAVLRRAVELGVNFIDTADSYGPEVSERLIGEALSPYEQGVVVATKAGLVRTGPNQWHPVGRPEYLEQEVNMSLRRLKVERLDLWQLQERGNGGRRCQSPPRGRRCIGNCNCAVGLCHRCYVCNLFVTAVHHRNAIKILDGYIHVITVFGHWCAIDIVHFNILILDASPFV